MLSEKWQRHYPDVRLVILHSEYRSVIRPISRFIDKINKKRMIKIMSLQLLCLSLLQKSWHNFLHNQTSIRLKMHLFYQKNVILATVPFKLHK